jgi:hypothetical protein
MPRFANVITAATLALLVSLAIWAQSPDTAKKTFQAKYAAMKSAMASRDKGSIMALLAPGFESVDVDGTVSDAESMAREVSALPQDPNKVSETDVSSVEQVDGTAVVKQRYHMTTTRTAKDGTQQAIDLVAGSTDTWVSLKGEWLLRRTVTETLDYRVNGKLIAHKQRRTNS